MSAQEMESILTQVEQLSPQEQLQLIKRITEMVGMTDKTAEPQGIVFGKRDDAPGQTATAEDAAGRRSSERDAIYKSIAAYAAKHAGSDADLDTELEAAAIEYWQDTDEEPSR